MTTYFAASTFYLLIPSHEPIKTLTIYPRSDPIWHLTGQATVIQAVFSLSRVGIPVFPSSIRFRSDLRSEI